MNTYAIKTTVDYYYEVEAENEAEAEEAGWEYEDYAFAGEVYSIKVELMEEDIDKEEEPED